VEGSGCQLIMGSVLTFMCIKQDSQSLGQDLNSGSPNATHSIVTYHGFLMLNAKVAPFITVKLVQQGSSHSWHLIKHYAMKKSV
jgi:hypothetical protein